MTNAICLDKNYSTTRLVSKKEPIITNKPEDKFETVLFLPPNPHRRAEGGLRTKGYFKFSYENLIMNDKFLILNDKNGNEFKLDNSTFNIQHSTFRKLPLISIITVVYNGEKYLEETIESVINQTYPNIEYIIIDGDSTDGTIDIIKKYEDKIDYWVSEKDRGIYDAMNKGIDLSNGEWILFLNSDDKFPNNNIVKNIFSNSVDKETMLIFGNVYYNTDRIFKSSLDKKILINNTVHHQASFYNKLLFCNFRYDLSWKIVSDYELNLIIYLKKHRIKYINIVVSHCNDGGISRTSFYRSHLEMALIRRKYFNFIINIIIDTMLIFKLFSYKFYKKISKILNIH